MRVIDSSGWIDYFTDGPSAETYAPHVEASDVLTPTVVLYEVYKVIRGRWSEQQAITAAAHMQRTTVVDLSPAVALHAAEVSLEHRLAMADAIVYASARSHQAELYTSDADLADLPGVTYIPKEGRNASAPGAA